MNKHEQLPIISARDLSRSFSMHIHRVSFRQETGTALRRLLGRDKSPQEFRENRRFMALQDVSFDIARGESVAIVGRNGSGKTTLLRILAQIMQPTAGRVEVRGRFTALIALGAGFIPSMTGRENIYLNAAMYGFAPVEVNKILDDIIDFADIGDFIDTPVKYYSSGMRARVGFSIAVHLVTDMVLIDEILSVGDGAFQTKSSNRIQEMLASDRTVVLVTHTLPKAEQLCNRVIWLHDGRIIMDAPTAEVMPVYKRFLANDYHFDGLGLQP